MTEPKENKDVWTNEDFAQWMEDYIVQRIRRKEINIVKYHFHKQGSHPRAERVVVFEYEFVTPEEEAYK